MTKKQIDIPTFAENEEQLPTYASSDAAGADARANIQEEMIIKPNSSMLIPTGLKMAIPVGYEIQVRPRSGLALKNQITVLNTPGTIDADYRGEISVILINHGKEDFIVKPGMRIAQLIVSSVIQANWIPIKEDALTATARGIGGFGHTGTH
ncbi:MAG TPA: dUTP diphosphatase [Parachlamydiaceae bacterium]|nr:dUTP diphosphatase [Parachlamydiaceae bacterium]